ncbi:uncharacterized protein [Dendropsophus ebraccatus]|uniref:uncharacterized protein n=1 Tax=Dendropsophus ebraccatus TaxID=150705 RepID=UPI0038320F38
MSTPNNYDEQTASTILSQVTTSSDFLRIPSHELRSRHYEKESRRLIAHELHSATLAEYHRSNRIPRGLRSNLRPTLFIEDNEYCEKFQAILDKSSLDIILLTLEFLQKSISTTKEKVRATEEQLSTSLNHEEWETLKTKTQKGLSEYKQTLEHRKREKFHRDAEDYLNNQVYKWQESSQSSQFGPPRRRHQWRDTSSSSSEASSQGRQQHFLGPRRGTRNPRGGRGRGSRDYGPRMQTRSQVN